MCEIPPAFSIPPSFLPSFHPHIVAAYRGLSAPVTDCNFAAAVAPKSHEMPDAPLITRTLPFSPLFLQLSPHFCHPLLIVVRGSPPLPPPISSVIPTFITAPPFPFSPLSGPLNPSYGVWGSAISRVGPSTHFRGITAQETHVVTILVTFVCRRSDILWK